MIFIDSNVPMYLVGAAHPNKTAARELLTAVVSQGRRLVTDAEVLQEILHRYHAIHRLDAIGPAFEVLLGVVDEVFAVDQAVVMQAREWLGAPWNLSARDAVHVAAMRAHGVVDILTFDQDFDRVPLLRRVRAG